MTSPSRLQVALPAAITFVFGLTFGLVAGRILWFSGGAARAHEGAAMAMPQGAGAGAGAMGGMTADPHDEGAEEAQTRRLLEAHEGLLEQKPEDVNLTRTVGNYHAYLGENDEALALYARARERAEKAGDQAIVTDVMIDEGIALVEKGDVPGGLKRLEEASARDAKDVRSRLTRVAVLLERVMPQPPPGWDRRQALGSAEALLDEIETLEPENEYARQFRGAIESVRGMMNRPRPDAPAPATPSGPAVP